MIFGGVMEGTGMLKRIAESIISLVNSTDLWLRQRQVCVFSILLHLISI